MKQMAGRVAVVTGAAHGIGLELAKGLAKEGCRLVLADLPSDDLTAARDAVRELGAECEAVPTDVSLAEAVEALAKASVDRFGAVHILCNNAGISQAGRLMRDLSLDDWRWMFGVNLWGPVHGIHYFMPILRRQDEAHVLNTASTAAFRGGAFIGSYSATKAALLSISESLYRECVFEGLPIGVTALCPGSVRSSLAESDNRRPAHFPGAAKPIDERMAAQLHKVREEGKPAEECAAVAIAAIKENRFYAFNDLEAFRAAANREAQALAGEQPAL